MGDPIKSEEFKNEMAAIPKLAADQGYTVCGSSTCLPGGYQMPEHIWFQEMGFSTSCFAVSYFFLEEHTCKKASILE